MSQSPSHRGTTTYSVGRIPGSSDTVCLNPLLIGEPLPTGTVATVRGLGKAGYVSIPFSSGNHYLPSATPGPPTTSTSLNPLLIGEPLPTRTMRSSSGGIRCVSIPFSSGNHYLPSRCSYSVSPALRSQSPSHRGTTTYDGDKVFLVAKIQGSLNPLLIGEPLPTQECSKRFEKTVQGTSQSPSHRGTTTYPYQIYPSRINHLDHYFSAPPKSFPLPSPCHVPAEPPETHITTFGPKYLQPNTAPPLPRCPESHSRQVAENKLDNIKLPVLHQLCCP